MYTSITKIQNNLCFCRVTTRLPFSATWTRQTVKLIERQTREHFPAIPQSCKCPLPPPPSPMATDPGGKLALWEARNPTGNSGWLWPMSKTRPPDPPSAVAAVSGHSPLPCNISLKIPQTPKRVVKPLSITEARHVREPNISPLLTHLGFDLDLLSLPLTSAELGSRCCVASDRETESMPWPPPPRSYNRRPRTPA